MSTTGILIPLIGVLGTIAGTALGGSLTYRADRTKDSREQRKYWRDQRLAAYTALLRVTSEQVSSALEHAHVSILYVNAKEQDNLTYELEEKLHSFERMGTSVRQTLASLELVASPGVAQAAHRLVQAAEDYDADWLATYISLSQTMQNLESKSIETPEEKNEREKVNHKHGAAKREEEEARTDFCSRAQRELNVVS